uniref:J domain-containing protein n=1 Tax=Eutreptiella gymnastica TaxID=73025 RepID=A0A7S1HWU1_9EUGL|mmetsp:Transcript_111297/g.193126  ORF Transcript_111297/g.193126 Transcript_111297/m.193126 type:complete len:511 (+) Transcript_111297:50-1582(+)
MTSDWKKTGNAKYNAGLYEGAVECYTKALEQSPSDKFLYGNRAQTWYKLNQFQKAIDDSQESTRLDPTFAKGYFRTGNAYLRLGNFDESEAQFKLSAEHGEEAGVTSAKQVVTLREDYAKAKALKAEGKPCVSTLQPVVLAATHNVELKTFFVEEAAAAELWDDVIAALKDTIADDLFKDNVRLRYLYTQALYFTVCFQEALKHVEKVLALEPEHEDAIALKKQVTAMQRIITSGKTYMTKNAFQWSVDAFTKAMAMEPTSPVLQKYLNVCRAVPLMHMEQYAEAIEDCTKALQGNTHDWRVKAWECRGFCYEAQGEFQLAIADYERAVALKANVETQERLHALRQTKPKRKDYYAILGVEKSADLTAVKTAYRRLALQYHPDRLTSEVGQDHDVDDEEKLQMKNKFQEISEAYVVLSDKERRARYDAGESLDTLHENDQDPFILFNILCGVLKEDAGLAEKMAHHAKQCCFWGTLCVGGVATCPCWAPVMYFQSEKHRHYPNSDQNRPL